MFHWAKVILCLFQRRSRRWSVRCLSNGLITCFTCSASLSLYNNCRLADRKNMSCHNNLSLFLQISPITGRRVGFGAEFAADGEKTWSVSTLDVYTVNYFISDCLNHTQRVHRPSQKRSAIYSNEHGRYTYQRSSRWCRTGSTWSRPRKVPPRSDDPSPNHKDPVALDRLPVEAEPVWRPTSAEWTSWWPRCGRCKKEPPMAGSKEGNG